MLDRTAELVKSAASGMRITNSTASITPSTITASWPQSSIRRAEGSLVHERPEISPPLGANRGVKISSALVRLAAPILALPLKNLK